MKRGLYIIEWYCLFKAQGMLTDMKVTLTIEAPKTLVLKIVTLISKSPTHWKRQRNRSMNSNDVCQKHFLWSIFKYKHILGCLASFRWSYDISRSKQDCVKLCKVEKNTKCLHGNERTLQKLAWTYYKNCTLKSKLLCR